LKIPNKSLENVPINDPFWYNAPSSVNVSPSYSAVEVWFGAKSITTFIPFSWAVSINLVKSSSVPKALLVSKKSFAQ
jgi:hypothetical protein